MTDYYTRRIDYSSYTDAMRGYDFHKDFNVTFEVLKQIYDYTFDHVCAVEQGVTMRCVVLNDEYSDLKSESRGRNNCK